MYRMYKLRIALQCVIFFFGNLKKYPSSTLRDNIVYGKKLVLVGLIISSYIVWGIIKFRVSRYTNEHSRKNVIK